MSEPWTSDFRALRDHTRRGAPSLERTRQFVLASAKTPETENEKEKSMSFIKRRPALAVAIALALIAVLTPVAYAVVNKVFLEIDPDQSEEQIEQDVKRQLDEAGVPTTGVTAEKDGNKLRIGIQSDDPAADLPELHVDVRGGGKAGETLGQNRVRIEAHCELSPEQMEALTQVVSSDEFLAAVVDRHDRTDAEVAAALREVLRRHGFADTDVSVSGQGVAVTVNAPPT